MTARNLYMMIPDLGWWTLREITEEAGHDYDRGHKRVMDTLVARGAIHRRLRAGYANTYEYSKGNDPVYAFGGERPALPSRA